LAFITAQPLQKSPLVRLVARTSDGRAVVDTYISRLGTVNHRNHLLSQATQIERVVRKSDDGTGIVCLAGLQKQKEEEDRQTAKHSCSCTLQYYQILIFEYQELCSRLSPILLNKYISTTQGKLLICNNKDHIFSTLGVTVKKSIWFRLISLY
jgi:hypothetical protein